LSIVFFDQSTYEAMVRRIKNMLSKRAAASPESSFRKRYDDVERVRLEMLQRLEKLDPKARAHPAFKRALILLNQSFRKAKLAQRGAVLSAAQWTIDLLETLTFFV
jgi:hypothetical protein